MPKFCQINENPDFPASSHSSKGRNFLPLPILCVAFRTFIPDRSVSRCFPLPCLSMFRPLVPMHKSAHSAAQPAAPPSHAPATPHHHTRQSQCNPLHIPAPAAALPAQATTRQHQEQRTHSRHCTAITPPHCTPTPHMPITPQSSQQIGASALVIIIQPHSPHTQA